MAMAREGGKQDLRGERAMELRLREGEAVLAGPIKASICAVCLKQFSKYACPRCNLRYCSLPCYKGHSAQCTESFYLESVGSELHGKRAGREEKKRMMEILKRMQFQEEEDEDEDDDDDDDDEKEKDSRQGNVLSEESLLRLLQKGDDVSLDDLSLDERKAFKKAVMSGAVSSQIELWQPWWQNIFKSDVSVGPHGASLVHEVETASERGPACTTALPSDEDDGCEEVAGASGIPAPPYLELPTLNQLTKVSPSPLLGFHLANIVYAYCFVMRLYNGEWFVDPLGVVTSLLDVSSVLNGTSTPQSMRIALEECVCVVCSASYKAAGGTGFAIGLMSDVAAVLQGGRGAVVRLLADVDRMVKASIADMGDSERDRDNEDGTVTRTSGRKRQTLEQVVRKQRRRRKNAEIGSRAAMDRLRAAERKAVFFLVWANERTDEEFEILAGHVNTERQSQEKARVGDHGAGNKTSQTQLQVLTEGAVVAAEGGVSMPGREARPLIMEMN